MNNGIEILKIAMKPEGVASKETIRHEKVIKSLRSMLQILSTVVSFISYWSIVFVLQFRRDVIKAVPLMMMSIPPFANYLVFVLM